MKLDHPISRLSIVMKMSVLAGSIAAIASFIVGTLIVQGSAEIAYQNALNRLKYETSIKSYKLVSNIKNLSDDAKYLAATPPIKGIPRAIKNGGIDPLDNLSLNVWQRRLTTIFSELIRAKPGYLQIRYIGVANNGKELVRVDRHGSVINKRHENELQQKGNTTYFKESLKVNPGETYLSDITLNRELGKVSLPQTPVIRAATPVYLSGELFGILVINMSFEYIFNEMLLTTPRDLTPYVTNEQGYFLAHPNKKMTYGFDLGHDHKIQELYKAINLNAKDLRDVEFTTRANGDVLHILKVAFDPSQRQRYFAVILATSYQNLHSGSDQLRMQSFMIMALLVIISLIVTAILASRLMRPLQLITSAADDLAHGREVSNLPVDSKDEIGELARSFDNMNKQLEDKERELIVSQGHVHHANKMASLGEMASGMAHEINSPIQTISLIAQRVQRQLKKGFSKKDIDNSMEKITTNVDKISGIIDSLRKVARNSSKEKFHNVKLKDLIEDVTNITEERFKVNNIKFEVHYHDVSENTIIQCQRLQINQVLINLVNNAYDAIAQMNDKWISVDFKKRPEKILISVCDSGPGIVQELQDKIFEPMFTTKEIGKGTGLGLSISREIILKHGGLFYIDKDTENTCFIIELPIIQTTHEKN